MRRRLRLRPLCQGVVEVANVAAQRLVGASAGRVLSGLIALVLASPVGAMIMAGSRVYEAMGCDHRALSFLARRTPPRSARGGRRSTGNPGPHDGRHRMG